MSFKDFLKNNAKDNLKGLMRGGGSPSETLRQTNIARRERRAQQKLDQLRASAAERNELANGRDEFQSRITKGGRVEYFEDKKGNPTKHYPHVHVTHHASGDVDIVASQAHEVHVWKKSLRNPSGNEVSNTILEARRHL